VNMVRSIRQEDGRSNPAQGERRRHADHGNQRRRQTHPPHVLQAGFEPHLEEQEHHAYLCQQVQASVRLDELQPSVADKRDVAYYDPQGELAQDSRLADAPGKVRPHPRHYKYQD